jgi:hypothetical protein
MLGHPDPEDTAYGSQRKLLFPVPSPNTFDVTLAASCNSGETRNAGMATTASTFNMTGFENVEPNSLLTGWDFAPPLDLFDLGTDVDWALNGPDVNFLSTYQASSMEQITQTDGRPPASLLSSPRSTAESEGAASVSEAFRRSIGRWTPDSRHYRGVEEQTMSSKETVNLKVDKLGQWDPTISTDPLTSRARDRLLAMALGSCEPGNVSAVGSAFPPVEVLDRLVNISVTSHKEEINGYIHVPTFSKSECRVEKLAACVIDGAIKSPNQAVRKFGLGLGEILGFHLYRVVRNSLPFGLRYLLTGHKAERDHTLTRDLEYLQGTALSLEVSLWSGIKHKMELAGSLVGVMLNVSVRTCSILLQFLTWRSQMMRAAGRYRRTAYKTVHPSSVDVGEVLDKKWRAWIEIESFKRYVR